jgi:hypothetical protein
VDVVDVALEEVLVEDVCVEDVDEVDFDVVVAEPDDFDVVVDADPDPEIEADVEPAIGVEPVEIGVDVVPFPLAALERDVDVDDSVPERAGPLDAVVRVESLADPIPAPDCPASVPHAATAVATAIPKVAVTVRRIGPVLLSRSRLGGPNGPLQ